MSISKVTTENRLRPFLLSKVRPDVLDALTNSTLLTIFNDVARDLNNVSEIHIARFYKQCNTTNAEDANLTNYILDRPALKVFSLKYNDTSWTDQKWVRVTDANGDGRIVFRTYPVVDTQLDIMYLGDTLDVTDDTDNIDLPQNILPEYLELLRAKILSEYGESPVTDYETLLQYMADKVSMKVQRRPLQEAGMRKYWFNMEDDGTVYEISHNEVGEENVTVDVSGNYIFIT